jgi:excisionase family DNA binding protein
MKENRFISTSGLAKILGVSRIAVYKRIKSGKIKAEKVGHDFVIDKKNVVELLGKELGEDQKKELRMAVKKTVEDYGETLRMLGKT